MSDRPPKLSPSALNVVWASRLLTLGEKVVWYHDWALDQGREDGSYISHESMAARLGGTLTAATVSKIRQRLKRLTLHEPLRRRDARNLGWISTLPRHCVPRTHREAPGLAVALDKYLGSLTAWSEQGGPDSIEEVDPTVQDEQTPRSNRGAAALGGRGETSALGSSAQAQLPYAFRENGVGARAPKPEKGDRLSKAEVSAFLTSLDRDVERGRLTRDQAARLRRVSGL